MSGCQESDKIIGLFLQAPAQFTHTAVTKLKINHIFQRRLLVHRFMSISWYVTIVNLIDDMTICIGQKACVCRFRFERLAQTTAEMGYLEHLGHLFQTIATALRRRWPVHAYQLPAYPAFK
jgi:hypothetical protein